MTETRLPRAAAARSSRAVRRRRAGAATLAAMIAFQSGCYRYVPLEPAAPPGTEIRLELNDRGRAALADSIGPTAHRIEGTLRSASDSAYQLDVRSIEYYSGQVQRWSGESLRVPMTFVSQGRERQFDRMRSFTVGASAAAAVVLAIIGADLVGGGGPGRTPGPTPPDGHQ